MKIAICNPPLLGPGVPLLSQNRQFQWYRSPITSYNYYSVVMGYAATLLNKNGYNVLWLDAVAEKNTYNEFIAQLKKNDISVVVIETKTPVIKQHWEIINDIKKQIKGAQIILVGDHVTALPRESFKQSRVDYVLAGGDYDFLLLNLVDYLSGKNKTYGTGVFYRQGKKIKSINGMKRGHDLIKLPVIDRKLTKWWLYSGDNGNFRYKPNAYTMIGRDCWWRRPSKDGKAGCTFCAWTGIFPQWKTGTPKQLLDEIRNLCSLGVKEIFDDTGTFPVGSWLKEFCEGMIERGLNKKIAVGCNMRAGALTQKEFNLMKKANFRFILYGLESVNQKTLDNINKGTTPRQLEDSLRMAKKSGLAPHVTVMFGYPWETKDEAQKTVEFTRNLYKKGYIDTLQATILIPYPGTALYDQAKKKGWLLTEEYDDYDMSKQILKTPMSEDELKKLVQSCYHSFWSYEFITRKLTSVRSIDDMTYNLFLGFKYVSKLLDFRKKPHV